MRVCPHPRTDLAEAGQSDVKSQVGILDHNEPKNNMAAMFTSSLFIPLAINGKTVQLSSYIYSNADSERRNECSVERWMYTCGRIQGDDLCSYKSTKLYDMHNERFQGG